MNGCTTVTPDVLRQYALPVPAEGGSKEERGRTLVIAGSLEVPGAALLTGTAVLRAGAGKLQIGTCRSFAVQLGLLLPEALVMGFQETPSGDVDPVASERLIEQAKHCNAVVIGPGMLDEDASGELAAALLAAVEGPTFVLDAGALTGLRQNPQLILRHEDRVVLTPHAGEMARFLGKEKSEIQADPLAAARRAAEITGAIVALKGSCTVIAGAQGEAWSCDHGNIGLATGGSGDVLAGILGGLLARGATPFQATCWAIYLHGEAGNRLAHRQGVMGFLARELAAEIPAIMAELAGSTA